MSYPHIKPMAIGGAQGASSDVRATPNPSIQFVLSLDGALDTALRSVPIPEGMLTRLQRLALTITDESNGQVDYLGC
jgi:hypothetical protein